MRRILFALILCLCAAPATAQVMAQWGQDSSGTNRTVYIRNPVDGAWIAIGSFNSTDDTWSIAGAMGCSGLPALTGDVTTTAGSCATTLAASGVTAGTYGDATHVAQVTFDAKGRATAASNVVINIPSSAVSGLGNLATQNAGTGLAISAGNLNLQPAQAATIGGVESIASAAHQWVAYIDTSGIPHQTQPSFADISGTNGVTSGGTGNNSLTTNVIYKGAGTSPMVASSCSDTGFVFQCSEPTSLGGNALLQGFTTGSAASTGQLLVLDASGDVEPATTSATDGFVGIAHANAASSGLTLNVAIAGEHVCLFDGPTTAKDWVVFSSTVAGDCHDTGSATRATGQYQIGQVLSTNASAGSYTVNIENQYTPAGGSGAGNVTGTGPSVVGDLPSFNNTSATGIGDSGFPVNPAGLKIFNVLIYGAKGDGSNQTTAINAAVTALESAGGGVLYFPAGTYQYCGTINFGTTSVVVRGDDGYASVITQANNCNANPMFVFGTGTVSVYHDAFENLLLDGNYANNSSTQILIKEIGTVGMIVSRNYFKGFGYTAIDSNGVSPTYVNAYPIIINNQFQGGAGNSCVELEENVSYGGNISGNIFETCNISLEIDAGAGEISITSNDFDLGGTGFYCNGCVRTTSSGNAFLDQSTSGAILNGEANVFTGNGVRDAGMSSGTGNAIVINGGTYNSVTGNQISNIHGTSAGGIIEQGTANYNNITGNNISNATTACTIVGANSVKSGNVGC